jgi:hypothetical protein
MQAALERLIRERAASRCEYCQLAETLAELPFQIDHIIAEKHQGGTTPENLALACYYCNSYKGPNIAGLDPVTGRLVRLYHPRRDKWDRHFAWSGPELQGQTGIARATIQVLWMNHPLVVETRRWLMLQGLHPPS